MIVAAFTSIDQSESLNLKKSVLLEVVKVLESPKVQEMELAQQVKEMLLESSLLRVSNEDLGTQIRHRTR